MPLLGAEKATRQHLQALPAELAGVKPRAIVVISAHWEEAPAVKVLSNPKPPMLYDYYGFPAESYEYKYNAPGDPDLASRIRDLLAKESIPCELDADRGYDHGVFVPLLLAYPAADVPVVAVSLHASLDPALHLRMGEALAPLRDDNILILASGMSFHNMRLFRMGGFSSKAATAEQPAAGAAFDDALTAAVLDTDRAKRNAALLEWTRLPGAREAHPREEHFMPLLVAAGTATDMDAAPPQRFFHDTILGARVSAFRFG